MDGLYLTAQQITDGAATLFEISPSESRLKNSQVDDLVSICRKYLKGIASNYPLRETFESLRDDADENNKCAKLAACLLYWQDLQFDNTAFAATNANKSGFTDSTVAERYDVFEYVFGLFWNIPDSISVSGSIRRVSTQGFMKRVK